jgi:hypothetical protein
MKIKRPHWRKMTWVVLVWNVLMVIWIVGGLASGHSGQDCGSLSQQECNDAANIGRGIGVAFLVVLWVVGDVILGILWLVTKGNRRPCPVCGMPVKAGVTKCGKCNHDFASAVSAAPQTPTT